MPKAANSPAPASEPAMRAESAVVRDTPIVAIKRSDGIVAPIRALRIAWSEVRTKPDKVAMTNTYKGDTTPVMASAAIIPARAA